MGGRLHMGACYSAASQRHSRRRVKSPFREFEVTACVPAASKMSPRIGWISEEPRRREQTREIDPIDSTSRGCDHNSRTVSELKGCQQIVNFVFDSRRLQILCLQIFSRTFFKIPPPPRLFEPVAVPLLSLPRPKCADDHTAVTHETANCVVAAYARYLFAVLVGQSPVAHNSVESEDVTIRVGGFWMQVRDSIRKSRFRKRS
jgi:hypothetical protein